MMFNLLVSELYFLTQRNAEEYAEERRDMMSNLLVSELYFLTQRNAEEYAEERRDMWVLSRDFWRIMKEPETIMMGD
jgi:hypothetical protein